MAAMPSSHPAASSVSPLPTPAVRPPEAAARLAQASRALWLATLSLMTAFMNTPAPAHRLLLARRISRNLGTLARQDCFAAADRERFVRLAARWQANAERLAPREDASGGGRGLLRALLPAFTGVR